jgi:hypothetical protein
MTQYSGCTAVKPLMYKHEAAELEKIITKWEGRN